MRNKQRKADSQKSAFDFFDREASFHAAKTSFLSDQTVFKRRDIGSVHSDGFKI